jgi:hypothetical protein
MILLSALAACSNVSLKRATVVGGVVVGGGDGQPRVRFSSRARPPLISIPSFNDLVDVVAVSGC